MANVPALQPMFSVVMGVYDVEDFILPAVRSVLQQTEGNFELIVVDDQSTDRTPDLVQSLTDLRIRLIRAPHEGSAAARNRGIALATGTYVAFLDGDDVWAPEKLRRYRELLTSRPGLDIAFDLVQYIDEHGALLPMEGRAPAGSPSFESLLTQNAISCGSAVVARRETLVAAGGFRPEMPACIDYDLWLRCTLTRPGNVACLAEHLTLYRRRPGQITGKWRRMEQAWPMLIERLERMVPDRVRAVKRKAASHWARYLGFLAVEQGDRSAAVRLLKQSLGAHFGEAVGQMDTWRLAFWTAMLFLPRGIRDAARRLAERRAAGSRGIAEPANGGRPVRAVE